MNRRLIVGLVWVTVLAQDLPSRLAAVLVKRVEKNGPGIVGMVIHDGRIKYGKGFGFVDLDSRRPVTLDMQFLLGSITKQFTAMAIMLLRERESLQVDDPLSKFCLEFLVRSNDYNPPPAEPRLGSAGLRRAFVGQG